MGQKGGLPNQGARRGSAIVTGGRYKFGGKGSISEGDHRSWRKNRGGGGGGHGLRGGCRVEGGRDGDN